MGTKDIVSKDVIRRITLDVANMLLELDIDADNIELIESEQQRVEDRQADLVAKVQPRLGGEPFILHVEIQNTNDKTMRWRMLRYLTDIALANPNLIFRQYLIYIGKAALATPKAVQWPELDYRFQILDMRDIDCNTLINKNNPNALVLAILCDFGERDKQTVVNQIFLRLAQLLGENSRRLREYIDMIEILSDNRDLKPNIDEAQSMLTRVDRTRLPSYQRGMEAGLTTGEARVLRRQLNRRFGEIPAWADDRLNHATSAELELWTDRVLDCDSLAAIFEPES